MENDYACEYTYTFTFVKRRLQEENIKLPAHELRGEGHKVPEGSQ